MAKQSLLPNVSSRRKVEGSIAKPQLTSLLDVMTILLVFLIQNFSASGNLIAVPKDLELAHSISKSAPTKAITIEVGLHHYAVDGVRIESIDGLQKELQMVQSHAREGIDSKSVMIQCDKGVDFKILKQVLSTCSKANIENFTLLVKGEG